ncbi:MAG: hypothetical protein EA358_00540, partial [Flavobacteriales bacterium]
DYQPQHFSCYVNGEEFVPNGAGTCRGTSAFYDPDGFLNTEPGYLTIGGQQCLTNGRRVIDFGLTPVFSEGIYDFSDTLFSRVVGYYWDVSFDSESIYLYFYKGTLEITKLEPQTYRPFVQGRIEGTFEMSCANDQGDTVHITDGSFSLNLR